MMAELKKSDLIKAAKELNDVLGLDPAIPVKKVDEEELKEKILEASGLVEPADELTNSTWKVINHLKELPSNDGDDDGIDGDDDGKDEDEDSEDPRPGKGEEEKKKGQGVSKNSEKGKEKEATKGTGKARAGVIKTIEELIKRAGKKGITKQQILEELIKRFPERDSKSMKNTIGVQVPARISKEKFELERLENGAYRVKK
jgi:hypothetical protein